MNAAVLALSLLTIATGLLAGWLNDRQNRP